MRRPYAAALVAALLCPAAARAQTDPTRDAEARLHFATGRDAFSRGDFATAVTEFERAYALSRRAQLLYNIGTTYERLHRWEEARSALQRYLDAVTDAPDRGEVEGRIRIIDVEIQHMTYEPPPPAPAAPPQIVVVDRPVVVQSVRPWQVTFWVAGGLTAVSGGLALGIGLLADQRYRTLIDTCAPPAHNGCNEADVSDMRLRQNLVTGSIIAAGTFAALTVTSFILDRVVDRPSAATGAVRGLAVLPTQGGALVGFGGTL
jgi:tetratricopeptide (TPR) repeat protein